MGYISRRSNHQLDFEDDNSLDEDKDKDHSNRDQKMTTELNIEG
jgi:hypothetical protein